MFNRLQRISNAIEALGALRNLPLTELVQVAQPLLAIVGDARKADSPLDYQILARRVLEIVAPLSSNEWDDGGVIALRVLERDAEWVEWLDSRANKASMPTLEGIPAGALPLAAYPRLEPVDLPERPVTDVAALSFAGGHASVQLLLKFLPAIVELVSALKELAKADD